MNTDLCPGVPTELSNSSRENGKLLDKRRVAASFGRAATSYDAMAGLQRQVGHQLLQKSEPLLTGRVLDLGCGTGYFSQQLINCNGIDSVIGLDIAEGMLAFADSARNAANIHWLCGDAEQLPLADNSIDGVFSSFAIQWCQNLDNLVAELVRVVKPNGVIALATTGPETLKELRAAWAKVDDYVHVNEFASQQHLLTAFNGAFTKVGFEEQNLELEYDTLKELTAELKAIGAHNLNSGQQIGLSGRQKVRDFSAAYELFRKSNGKLPASYQVFFALFRGSLG